MFSITQISSISSVSFKKDVKLPSCSLMMNNLPEKNNLYNVQNLKKLVRTFLDKFKIEHFQDGMKGYTTFYRPNDKIYITKRGSIEHRFSLWLESKENNTDWFHKDY